MVVVTVSTSSSPTSLGLSRSRITSHESTLKKPVIIGFESDKNRSSAELGVKTKKHKQKKLRSVTTKPPKTAQEELDFSEAAAKLERMFTRSPETDNIIDNVVTRSRGRRKKSSGSISSEEVDEKKLGNVVKNRMRKVKKRLSLDKRIQVKKSKVDKGENNEDGKKIEEVVREYSASTDLVSLDWKKMKIPHVLPSSHHAWLFNLMEPMKALLQVKENLHRELGRYPTDSELGEAMNMTLVQVRRHMEVGHAARNKLIKHNLRLVLFVMNKYFQDLKNGPKFQDMCQEGVKGLITAIDRFEPSRRFRLSTYALFWIRHAIIRSLTRSTFTRVSFGLESIRVEIKRAKLELMFELKRMPRDEEIIERVGISHERYKEVMRASNQVISLHSRHHVTQEEFINGIPDVDGGVGDDRRQPARLRLALDDVLDSLKPKESLVMRQRYGLDGKGERTLGEIAGNLSISREMVRKHEMKALLKLKHPTRLDYLRRYIHSNHAS